MDSIESFKILAVDDFTMNIELLKGVLEESGYKVITSNNPQKALQLIPEINPDLVLVDLMMPKMSGFTFIEKMRDVTTKDIPVIIITARTDENDVRKAKMMKVFDYMTKPIVFPRLLSNIEKLISQKQHV